jgi:predicted Fe-Mo cluster-binding NifX family protein
MEKIALAVWNNRISPVFDASRTILLLTLDRETVIARELAVFANDNPVHKLRLLSDLGVQTLICGAISRELAQMLGDRGITTLSFVTGAVDDVLAAHLAGGLPNYRFSMPGCRCRCERRRGRGRGREKVESEAGADRVKRA